MQESRLDVFRLQDQLGEEERQERLDLGLFYVTYIPMIRENRRMLIALAEWWHSEMSSFHLLIGEASVTLEDVYRILRLPIRSKQV